MDRHAMDAARRLTQPEDPVMEPLELDARLLERLDVDREAFELAVSAGLKRPSVDVVVVTFNSRGDLERSFASIRRAARAAGARVIVADNASEDGSAAFCHAAARGDVVLVPMGANLGYAAAVNAGVRRSTADYVVVLNPDVEIPDERALVRLVDHLESHPEAAAAAPALLNADWTPQPSARRAPTLGMVAARQTRLGRTAWGRRQAARYLALPSAGPDRHVATDWALGAALAIRRTDFDRVGGWDAGFFLYFEDVDFCRRLWRAGRQVHYVPGVQLVHDYQRASDRGNGSALRSQLRRAHVRSAARFFRKHPALALGSSTASPARRAVAAVTRRALDVAVALVALVLLAPLLAVVASAIRLDSPGSVVFRQRRIGKNGASFVMLKFRTMRPGAELELDESGVRAHVQGRSGSDDAPVFKVLHPDPRVTRVGGVLRRWSLDELPQLLNVLRGEMTLVGYRPPTACELPHYPEWYRGRFAVKPGLTGLWQVSGRNARTYREMVMLDLEYIARRSLWLDLRLLARTLPALLRGREAA